MFAAYPPQGEQLFILYRISCVCDFLQENLLDFDRGGKWRVVTATEFQTFLQGQNYDFLRTDKYLGENIM